MDEQNPSQTTQAAPSADGLRTVDSSVGSPEPVKAVDLGKLGEAFGTTFTDQETAIKSVKELISKVGDQTLAEQRKAAERYKQVTGRLEGEALENGFSNADEYVEYLLETAGNKQAPTDWKQEREVKYKETAREKEYNELKEKVSKIEFEKEVGGEALKYYDAIKIYAQANNLGDLKVAYEKSGFKDLVEADRTKAATSVIENSQVKAAGADYERDFKAAQETGDWSSFLAKHKGVRIGNK